MPECIYNQVVIQMAELNDEPEYYKEQLSMLEGRYACLLLLRLPGADLLRWVTAFGDKRVLCGSIKPHGIFLYIRSFSRFCSRYLK